MRILYLSLVLLLAGCSPPCEVDRTSLGKIVSVEYTEEGFNYPAWTIVETESATISLARRKNIPLGVTAYQLKFDDGIYWFTWEGGKRRYAMGNPIK